jgi:hypothetical protein
LLEHGAVRLSELAEDALQLLRFEERARAIHRRVQGGD